MKQHPDALRGIPIGKRPPIGHKVLDEFLPCLKACGDSGAAWQYSLDNGHDWVWAPLRIWTLNVGFRGLMPSLQAVTHLTSQLRCDIRFLRDLKTPHRKFGRVRQSLEGTLHEEWQLPG